VTNKLLILQCHGIFPIQDPDGINLEMKTVGNIATCNENIASWQPDYLVLVPKNPEQAIIWTEEFKDIQKEKNIKVLIAMKNPDPELRKRILMEGIDDYLLIPCSSYELNNKLSQISKSSNIQMNDLYKAKMNANKEKIKESEDKIQDLEATLMNVSESLHNMQNPLTVINGYANSLFKELPDNVKVQRLQKAVKKMKLQIKEVLHTRQQHSDTVINIIHTIHSELEYIETNEELAETIDVQLNLGKLPKIEGSQVHFSQVISNVIKNAIDAMHGQEHKVLKIESSIDANDEISLIISDNGPGIPQEIQSKVFDPLFTTKPQADLTNLETKEPSGTGLGLPSCRRILEMYQGSIDILKSDSSGTAFILKFSCKTKQSA